MDKAALLKDLRKQVTVLEDDLRERTESVDEFRADLEREYAAAREGSRTAATYGAWRDERVIQAAAAWVLATVFVRFCEDNGLVEDPFIAGPGERLADAEELQAAFFRKSPELNDRDWLVAGFKALAESHEAVGGLFDREHNPLWELTPSYEAATRLLAFWRERDADGEIRYDFTDREELDTRFLGDLYQDLSEHARKTYALLQTPEFVEEFILDLTLEPAVEEFGLDPEWKHKPRGWVGDEAVVRGLRCIDPACGSGHFLLGMFERLLRKWRAAEPGTEDWTLVRRALDSVHGCDKNPFAVGIARFRLLVAVLKACGDEERRLAVLPGFPINVAVGDSLLHGRGIESVTETLDTLFAGDGDERTFAYRTEDVWDFSDGVDLLGRDSYHVVVGNPPYITVKDKQENANYRKAYGACAGTYALSVPFAQRIFELAVRAEGLQPAGFTGQITANSFMKREFGKKLIEEYFVSDRVGVTLTHVVDTSGAYIPGHGTPTVILAGRNRLPSEKNTIRAVLGVRGEPDQPTVAAKGRVWKAIREQIGEPGSESEWVSSIDAAWKTFATHPWSLSGGGAGELAERITRSCEPLRNRIEKPIGRAIRAGADEAFMRPLRPTLRTVLDRRALRPLMVGEVVRDWAASPMDGIWYPYDGVVTPAAIEAELFPWRTFLAARRTFQGDMAAAGLRWWEYMQHTASAYETPLSITFAEVATHNHFVLDRGGNVFKQTAPVIKLPEGATEEEYLELLGVLNSSVGCFWLKQVSHDKGSQSGTGGFMHDEWERFYQFNATRLQGFPVPAELPLDLGRGLGSLVQELAAHEPSAVVTEGAPLRMALDEARAAHASILSRMIALQEELDWTVYGSYNLLTPDELARTTLSSTAEVPEVALGERSFEIVLARKVAAGQTRTVWFDRHGSEPITEIPAHWPGDYRAVVQARIDVIMSREDIALIERPECKRRWASEPWEKREKGALRAWLLNRCEDEKLWFALRDGMLQPRTSTVSQLADALRQEGDVQTVAELYAADHLGKRDATLVTVLAEVLSSEHVPYLAALRYKESGLRKREQWENVWDLQRQEGEPEETLGNRVPPKYSSGDFSKTSYWSRRGKLDVPKERFISYPDASSDSDPTLLLGWAGWDHKDQAQALVNLVNDRTEQAAWDAPRLAPLLAGIQELMPWVHQWHGEHDEEWGGIPAEEYQTFLDEQCTKHGLSADELKAWRP
ncbi:BREX-2 system adenine-specific DNA-methyltransferase PglX [Streptomyces sp. NBC_01381]|uniref:BREX-2 system adenine-specific DNA-methyltransferase PglX n=1 Tax=Streptomyces sp. NBC_01381 TaxID=2903845 RepID=UPI002B1CF36E|nr:BREX-2 system adenine-specific DNA-methyltransferase PglX [Streptomyces sp. NBC_01381]